jgi:hypothetical protein
LPKRVVDRLVEFEYAPGGGRGVERRRAVATPWLVEPFPGLADSPPVATHVRRITLTPRLIRVATAGPLQHAGDSDRDG